MPLIIGVAGAIATGKSSACKVLERHGAVHCDADKLVHTLYEPGKPAFDRIVTAFGEDVVGADGFIDRRLLGAKVFGKPEEMKRLGKAIGNIREAVDVVVDEWNATMSKADVAIMEAVSLIEAGYGEFCHQVWLFATRDQDLARQRLMVRNNFTEAEADQRLASQRPWEERESASDVVLFNDSDLETLERQTLEAFHKTHRAWMADTLPRSKYYDWWETVGRAKREAAEQERERSAS
ncbi:dephospho-CoA kinase [Candidatus Entotheonella palauensis]|nr:dephospho-CoA kinase [Candidatus Entotheonella palauensis]